MSSALAAGAVRHQRSTRAAAYLAAKRLNGRLHHGDGVCASTRSRARSVSTRRGHDKSRWATATAARRHCSVASRLNTAEPNTDTVRAYTYGTNTPRGSTARPCAAAYLWRGVNEGECGGEREQRRRSSLSHERPPRKIAVLVKPTRPLKIGEPYAHHDLRIENCGRACHYFYTCTQARANTLRLAVNCACGLAYQTSVLPHVPHVRLTVVLGIVRGRHFRVAHALVVVRQRCPPPQRSTVAATTRHLAPLEVP